MPHVCLNRKTYSCPTIRLAATLSPGAGDGSLRSVLAQIGIEHPITTRKLLVDGNRESVRSQDTQDRHSTRCPILGWLLERNQACGHPSSVLIHRGTWCPIDRLVSCLPCSLKLLPPDLAPHCDMGEPCNCCAICVPTPMVTSFIRGCTALQTVSTWATFCMLQKRTLLLCYSDATDVVNTSGTHCMRANIQEQLAAGLSAVQAARHSMVLQGHCPTAKSM